MQKVRILKQTKGRYETVVDCAAQFNPDQLKLKKKASWKTEKVFEKNSGNTVFAGGDPISLSVDLFFDSTDSENGDVRQYTDPLMALTMIDLQRIGATKEQQAAKKTELVLVNKRILALQKELAQAQAQIFRRDRATRIRNLQQELDATRKRKAEIEKQVKVLDTQNEDRTPGSNQVPPKCKFVWGSFAFTAIVESVKLSFIMFRSDGTPVRAKAKVKMKQIEEDTFYPPQNPTSRSTARKVWVVREGQRLDWIAYQEYGDSSKWRYLAEINNLDNPMELYPGQILDLV